MPSRQPADRGEGEGEEGDQHDSRQEGIDTSTPGRMKGTQQEGTHRPTGQDPYLVTVPRTAAIRPDRPPLQGSIPVKASRHAAIGGGVRASRPLRRRQWLITSPEADSVRCARMIRGGLNAIPGGVHACGGLSIQPAW